MSAAIMVTSIVVIILVVGLVVGMIIWMSVECKKKNVLPAVAAAVAMEKRRQRMLHPAPPPPQDDDDKKCGSGGGGGDVRVPSFGAAHSSPPSHGGIGSGEGGPRVKDKDEEAEDAYFQQPSPSALASMTTPEQEDEADRAGGVYPAHLMPSTWRSGASSAKEDEWAASAPTKEDFMKYVRMSGAAKFGINTRGSNARNVGIMDMVANAVKGGTPASAPTPIGTDEVIFCDTDARQSAIYNATGKYPQLNWC